MFEFQCIINLYYIKNKQDATLAVLFISHCKMSDFAVTNKQHCQSCILFVIYINKYIFEKILFQRNAFW